MKNEKPGDVSHIKVWCTGLTYTSFVAGSHIEIVGLKPSHNHERTHFFYVREYDKRGVSTLTEMRTVFVLSDYWFRQSTKDWLKDVPQCTHETMEKLMKKLPSWGQGTPTAVEGWEGMRFKK